MIGGVQCSAPLHGSGAAGTELHPGINENGSKSSSQRRTGHSASAEVSGGEGTWNRETGCWHPQWGVEKSAALLLLSVHL